LREVEDALLTLIGGYAESRSVLMEMGIVRMCGFDFPSSSSVVEGSLQFWFVDQSGARPICTSNELWNRFLLDRHCSNSLLKRDFEQGVPGAEGPHLDPSDCFRR
jgi:hypothetical protein